MKGANKEKITEEEEAEREMATSEERDGRKRRLSEKGLNRMVHITSERAQSTSSSSLPGHDHDHQPPQSLLDQTKGNQPYGFKGEKKHLSLTVSIVLDQTF